MAEEASYSLAELDANETYWKGVSTERTLWNARLKEGLEQGLTEGRKEGREKGREEGREKEKIEIAKHMKSKGISELVISECTGLTVEQIMQL